MSDRKRKASSSEEPVCVLCGRAGGDPDIFGRTIGDGSVCTHEFCLTFAHIALEERPPGEESVAFDHAVLTHRVKQANQKQCCVCGERGAAITCAESGCERSFHLPCAADGECITQYFGEHRSFCWEHRPRQAAVAAPAEDTSCVICQETVGDCPSYHTLVCPACTHTCFHRACIQQHALNAGTVCFRCPACRDSTVFCTEMSTMGIQIPARRPLWEDNRMYTSLLERHRRCDARKCLYPRGRRQADLRGPWQLILCSSCAAVGTHRRCSCLSNTTTTWECDSCAGLGTASSTIAQLAALSAASQQGLGTSHSRQEPEDSCSGPTIQPASGPSHTSQLLELSSQNSESGQTEHGTTRSHFPDPQDASELHQAHCGSRCAAAPSAESSSHPSTRRGTSGSSRADTAPARRRHPRQRGTSRTRSRSPLQGPAPRSHSRTRRPQGSRRTAAPAAQNSTHSTSRAATQRTSRASLPSHTGERPRQPGEARMQRRSSVAHRAPRVSSRP
ncbi:PHD finger protein 7-like isoform X3 [Gallus gallus]|uniref:PHD finger protein 7-like isoform X3 n=1 Tax=Gallus gallus TaxID=9031 RepID=UPI001AE1B8D6|nr:PHD finger protein 7-like isoform X3 [Gallus gallus]